MFEELINDVNDAEGKINTILAELNSKYQNDVIFDCEVFKMPALTYEGFFKTKPIEIKIRAKLKKL